MRTIKRYENRKLYDTETKQYVSLKEIAELVRNGETIAVEDKATGDDLTSQVLTQVILEEGKRGRSMLSTDFLHNLLRKGNAQFDAKVTEIKTQVDGVLKRSVDKLTDWAEPHGENELQQLRSQLGQLESMLSDLLDGKDDAPESAATTKEVNHERQ